MISGNSNSSLSTYGSLSVGCRIYFSEDFRIRTLNELSRCSFAMFVAKNVYMHQKFAVKSVI